MKIKAPFVEAMHNYRKANVYPLHTPGHKGGRGADPFLQDLVGSVALQSDVSLMEELDDIHAPTSCLKEAETLAANLYGADRTFFAPNGTTGAIHAMLLGTLAPKDKVLVPRNAHRSVAGALILTGVEPVYLEPHYSKEWNLGLQITPQEVAAALQQDPRIKAVVLTSPNYYGLCADVQSIAAVAHKNGALLLVDEAHGAHLGFSNLLPPAALQSGADVVAQSTHKIVGALTQCSLLHARKQHVDLERLAAAMSLVTTTSPNNLLLASLDIARAQLAAQGEEMMAKALSAANLLRTKLAELEGAKVLAADIIGQGGVVALDPTKVTLHVAGLGLTGKEAGSALREEGLAVELVDASNVLFLVTYADDHASWSAIVAKIIRALQKARKAERKNLPHLPLLQVPPLALTPRTAFFGQKETALWVEARGRISGEEVCFYPPGVPVLLPGEVITQDVLTYCQDMLTLGLKVTGPKDTSLRTIQVMKI